MLLRAQPHCSARIPFPPYVAHSSNYVLIAPLFSAPYEPLFSQAFCFQRYLRCPLVFKERPLRSTRITDPQRTTVLLSMGCALLNSLAPLFRAPFLCFQWFVDSFCETRGWHTPRNRHPFVFMGLQRHFGHVATLCHRSVESFPTPTLLVRRFRQESLRGK